MPIYEYSCPKCGSFEEWLRSDDESSAHPCPTCGASAPRIMSNTTFILKGGGWYVTEYGGKSGDDASHSSQHKQEAAEQSSAPAEAASPSADSSKTESKAEAAPAASPAPASTTASPASPKSEAAVSKSADVA